MSAAADLICMASCADAMLEALPVAVYTTDAAGRITAFNDAAAAFWGRAPNLGEECWCGSHRLFWPDGRPMAHDECPMAVTLKTGEPVRDVEAILERPDGSRVHLHALSHPLDGRRRRGHRRHQHAGRYHRTAERRPDQRAFRRHRHLLRRRHHLQGPERHHPQLEQGRGAHLRLHRARKRSASSVVDADPADRQNEEPGIIERIRRGERIEHYETIRQRKDGSADRYFPHRFAGEERPAARSSAPPRSRATSPKASAPRKPATCCCTKSSTG